MRFPWGTKPWGQQQRQHPTFEGTVEKKKNTENHGHSKDHGYNQDTAQPSRVRLKQKKRNDKYDAQPPRLRRTKQASPPDLKIYLYLFL